jgi:carboxyl-terminal processing protease
MNDLRWKVRRPARPTTRKLRIAAVAVGAVALIGAAPLAYAGQFRADVTTSSTTAPACVSRGSQPPPTAPPTPKPTTVTTLQQAYYCILTNYYAGPVMDDRTLLVGAFTRFTAELMSRGVDQATATLPKLTGDHQQDWDGFADMYRQVLKGLPNDAVLQQAVAAATMQGMIDSLQDNHVAWDYGPIAVADFLKLGFVPAFEGRHEPDIRASHPPMYVKTVVPSSPAADGGLKAGDVIEAVDGIPVFVDGQLDPGTLDILRNVSGDQSVAVKIFRAATGRTWTVALHVAATPQPPTPQTSVTLVDGGVADVVYPSFDPDAADQVLAEIASLGATTTLHGVILDIRGNGGGRPEAVAKLLGAFVHGKVWSWDCDVKNNCTADTTDDSVSLLNVPLVVLTDSSCFSACDMFSAAVRDLGLGPLVGSRTGGVAAGKPSAYSLEDDSGLELVTTHAVGANGEIVNTIGVAVDYQEPTTAQDISTGKDPALDKARALLHS